ncbi:hypothetical protein F183_A31890 [Bryobacterales bacterium F-183]|nr:hypothetical protein F183_A31890 [Bryobacterales bacterium F-183]
MRRLLQRLLASLSRRRHDDAFRDELDAHIEMIVDERMAQGATREAALREARIRLGGVAQLEDAHREWRGLASIERLLFDVRYALRTLRLNPGFAAGAILTTAVAVGAATAVFSLADRSLFRPLPYGGNGDRLAHVGIHAPLISAQEWLFAGTFQQWLRMLPPAVEAFSAWRTASACDWNPGTPERTLCAHADHRFLPALQVTPVLGRNFTEEEDRFGAAPVALASFDVWQSRFGGDHHLLGRSVTVDGVAARIVGVLPREFRTPGEGGVERPAFLMPLRLREGAERQRVIQAIALLRPGVSIAMAREQFEALYRPMMRDVPADFRKAIAGSLRVIGIRDQMTASYRHGLMLLIAAVACFLLLSCSNVASLLLARAEARRHEYEVRAALGATRGRLAQQALTESLLIGLAASCVGAGLAWALLRGFRAWTPTVGMRLEDATVDLRVLLFAIGLSLAAGVLFGLGPAFFRKSTVARQPMRTALTAIQIAVSCVLLTASGLMARSLWNLERSKPGFRAEYVVTGSFVLPAARYAAPERQIAFFRDLEDRLRAIPGVTAAAISDSVPPGGDPRSVPYVALVGGGDASAEGLRGLVKWRYVTPGYFRAMGIPILHGRAFEDADRAAADPVVIVSEGLARRRFGGVQRAGPELRKGERVIGVAADVRNAGLASPPDPEYYILRSNVVSGTAHNQRPPHGWRSAVAIVRSSAAPEVAVRLLREAVHAAEPSMPVVAEALPSQLGPYLARPRFHAALLSAFALIALLLATAGLYGLTSYLAAMRRRELGVRIAVGATRMDLIVLLARSGVRIAAFGLLAGFAVSLSVTRLLQSFLFEVQPLDTGVLAVSFSLLAVSALAGSVLPALRSSRTPVLESLRHQ